MNNNFKNAYPSYPSNAPNAALPSLSGEGVYWEFPQYDGVQKQYASNGIFLGNPTL